MYKVGYGIQSKRGRIKLEIVLSPTQLLAGYRVLALF